MVSTVCLCFVHVVSADLVSEENAAGARPRLWSTRPVDSLLSTSSATMLPKSLYYESYSPTLHTLMLTKLVRRRSYDRAPQGAVSIHTATTLCSQVRPPRHDDLSSQVRAPPTAFCMLRRDDCSASHRGDLYFTSSGSGVQGILHAASR